MIQGVGMNVEFLSTLSEEPEWKILRHQLLSYHLDEYRSSFEKLNSYQLVHVAVDEKGSPLAKSAHAQEPKSYLVFTEPSLRRRFDKAHSLESLKASDYEKYNEEDSCKLVMMMLGELIDLLKTKSGAKSIKVNPALITLAGSDSPFLLCDEVLFAPGLDPFTQKLLMTDPADAKALLGIDPRDQKRFGIELVFFMITNRSIASNEENISSKIIDKIDELAFIAPRIPMKKGSGTFLIVVVSLDNEIEEQAFIRDYKMFDEYSNVLFVTSSLKLLTGQLNRIHYNGESIDTIFEPMIKWQKKTP